MTQHKLIRRQDWGMQPFGMTQMQLPVPDLYVHHSVTNGSRDGIVVMREIDEMHRKARKNGFAYSYAIHPYTGDVFEGKGGFKGAHTAERNSISLGVVFLGDFEPRTEVVNGVKVLKGLDRLSGEAIDSFQWLVDLLKHEGKITQDCRITPHGIKYGGVVNTACPGGTIAAMLPVLRRPWMAPVTIPTLPVESEDDVRPNMLLTSDQDPDGLVVAQYGTTYDRVNLQQMEEFLRQGVMLIKVLDGADWLKLKERLPK